MGMGGNVPFGAALTRGWTRLTGSVWGRGGGEEALAGPPGSPRAEAHPIQAGRGRARGPGAVFPGRGLVPCCGRFRRPEGWAGSA